VILATGSQPVELPFLPFSGNVISSEGALQLDRVPERLVVVGGGYIGVELGSAFAKFGSQVTIVEAQERILPLYDRQLTDPVRKWLEKQGVVLHLGAKARGMDGEALAIETADGQTLKLEADKVMVTVGRRPVTQGFGLETMGVDMAGPFIKVDDQRRTSMKNVWAVGDVVGEPMLAHKSSAEGEMVAEIIAGHRRTFDP
jgi:dihydrolipoamide dehydrogenase